MPRVFIALQTPSFLQQALEEVRSLFEPLPIALRWVSPSNLHATLKFLGDVPEVKLDSVFSAVTDAAAGQGPFVLQARALGCFPSATRPRVLWMGLDDPHNNLRHVHQKLDSALTDAGFSPEEHQFHPHLTLARIRRPLSCPPFKALLATYQTRCFGEIKVDKIDVFQSQLQPTGSIYSVLHTVLL